MIWDPSHKNKFVTKTLITGPWEQLRDCQALKQEIIELKSAQSANQRETENPKTQLTKAEKANNMLREALNQNEVKRSD